MEEWPVLGLASLSSLIARADGDFGGVADGRMVASTLTDRR